MDQRFESKMEPISPLKTLLNSPLRLSIPAVPTPDWSSNPAVRYIFRSLNFI